MPVASRSGSAALLSGVAILTAQVSITLGAALAKSVFAQSGPETVAALRTVLAASLLALLVRPKVRTLAAATLGWVALYGLALGGMNLLIYEALRRLPIGIAVGVEICGPLCVALAGARSAREALWPLLAACGLAVLIPWPGRGHPLDPAGLGFALGAACCWAMYIVFGRRASRAGSGTAVALGMLAACLVTVPSALAAHAALPPAPVWAAALGVAMLSSVFPYLLEMRAMAALPARVVGLISSAAPAIAALVGYIALGEALTPLQLLAIALLITAAAGCSLQSRPPVARIEDEPPL
ncbi:EamA family transporter [Novosphingobium sp. 1949]|uniref:EamA family transporter n=1 Tax=Novosphingobium organovorum TaxID=2930092 RepID=A0ABT0BDH5_9SPHN|nr:EamA family transporter [Novosphingobium organovorum]MCJ2183095.1 EamA family transporter [Novosphingobium organovorum]